MKSRSQKLSELADEVLSAILPRLSKKGFETSFEKGHLVTVATVKFGDRKVARIEVRVFTVISRVCLQAATDHGVFFESFHLRHTKSPRKTAALLSKFLSKAVILDVMGK